MAANVRPVALNIQQFVQFIMNSAGDINRQIQQTQAPDVIDSAIFRVDSLIVNLHRVQLEINDDETFSSLDELLKGIYEELKTLQPQEDETVLNAPYTQHGWTGRPKYIIYPQQLEYLLGLGFHVTDIASMLGVHRSTIHDRLKQYGLSKTSTYAVISDQELDAHVKEIVQHNRNIGYRGVKSRLDAGSIKVPFQRVRQALLRVDQGAVALRLGNTVQRRVYRVAGPNSLWHFDGNHKLIRFKFVVHGGIDGYSRMIVWLKVATNNKAQTVFNAFEEAERQYGLPSRVRCDKGVENGKVVEYMIRRRGAAHRAALVGPSVHNQRIERLWVDLFQGSLCVFYDLFSSLLVSEAVDLSSAIQMFAFQFTFTPIIQRSLDRFREGHNKHVVTSESCRTPEQLFFRGMYDQRVNPSTGVRDFWDRVSQGRMDEEGIDEDGPVPELDHLTSEVRLEDIVCPVSDDILQEMKDQFDPCAMCSHDNALDVYASVLRFLRDKGYN